MPVTTMPRELVGLTEARATAMGRERAAKVRTFRLLSHLGQHLRFLADTLYREDGVTSQQAMLLGVVDMLDAPSLRDTADAFGTTYQNVKQIANALVKKGLLTMERDPDDARVLRLATTARNRRHWARRDRDDFDVVETWFAELSKREAEELVRLLLLVQRSVLDAVSAARRPSPA